jgi:hypothetical protein
MLSKTIKIIIIGILIVALAGGAVFAAQAKYKGFPVANLMLNGQRVTPPSPAIIIDGTTYVPLRFVSESMGIKVAWDGKTQTVIIGEKQAASTPAQPKNEIAVKDASGKVLYALRINKVTTMTERNPFADTNPVQVVMIDYTYTNVASDEDVYISELNFKVVDSAGKVGYLYPNSPKNYPQRIPKGTTCNAQVIFGLDTKSDKVKIHFYKDLFGPVTATFELPVE